LFVLGVVGASDGSQAAVEWEVTKTLSLESEPLDVTSSIDGSSTFVLLEGGEVLIFSANGEIKGRLRVGEHATRIASSPKGDQLFVTSGANKSIEIVSIDFVLRIDVARSPFKGAADAPVTIAVFNDFQ
jgi:hypothetical protein